MIVHQIKPNINHNNLVTFKNPLMKFPAKSELTPLTKLHIKLKGERENMNEIEIVLVHTGSFAFQSIIIK